MIKYFNKFCAIFFVLVVFSSSATFAAVSESVKNKMYDDMLSDFFKGIEIGTRLTPTSEVARQKFIKDYKGNFNKQDFINKTSACFAKYNYEYNKMPVAYNDCAKKYMEDYAMSQMPLFDELMKSSVK